MRIMYHHRRYCRGKPQLQNVLMETVLYPLTCVDISVGGKHLEVEAAVSNTLPTAVLLGTDVPELSELLREKPKTKKCEEEECDVFVVTRASAREQQVCNLTQLD
uniref:Uncharacterized protein n=1 Tax=Amphimedon queenslandica TaxID=400682 RepID=A0A1X7V3N4_AMPQE